ncbi:MAG: type IV secretion system DNA-binding domain-containing protein, partial [bacterium]|nr:type IV secretion system DNA-binding domain-containing protein [bacterium]
MLQLTLNVNAPEIPSAGLITAGIIIGFYGGITLLVVLLRVFFHWRHKKAMGIKKTILLVSVPKEAAEKKSELEKQKSLQEIQEDIAIGEKLFAAIGGLRAQRGFSSWFFGRSDLFSFEIVAREGLIWFYIAVPPKFKEYITGQIHALYSNAQIEEIEDYNIFSPQGAIAGGYLTLKAATLFPLRTYRKLEADPIDALTNVLSRVGKEDGAVIQYVVRSARKKWRRYGAKVAIEMQKGKSAHEAMASISAWHNFLKGFQTKKRGPGGAPAEEASKRFLSSMEQEQQKAIQEKASKAGLDFNIRVVVSAKTNERAHEYLKDIMNAFVQYDSFEYGNSFGKSYPKMTSFLIRDFIYRGWRQSRRVTVGSEEAAGLWHLPLPTTETPNIRWLLSRKAPPPVNIPKDGLTLGYNRYRGAETVIKLKRDDRRRHLYVIGKSGSGKSVFIENMAIQDIIAGEGVCVVDPHGDLIEHILAAVPKERIDEVIIFEPSDTELPVGLNMLEAKDESTKDFAAQEMIAIFYKLFPP